MARRAHLRHPDRLGGRWRDGTAYEVTFCGRVEATATLPLVDDPSLADCRRCLDALERDANPPDVAPWLRQRAYSRALAMLRDRHRGEFDELLGQALDDVIAEEHARADPQALHTC